MGGDVEIEEKDDRLMCAQWENMVEKIMGHSIAHACELFEKKLSEKWEGEFPVIVVGSKEEAACLATVLRIKFPAFSFFNKSESHGICGFFTRHVVEIGIWGDSYPRHKNSTEFSPLWIKTAERVLGKTVESIRGEIATLIEEMTDYKETFREFSNPAEYVLYRQIGEKYFPGFSFRSGTNTFESSMVLPKLFHSKSKSTYTLSISLVI